MALADRSGRTTAPIGIARVFGAPGLNPTRRLIAMIATEGRHRVALPSSIKNFYETHQQRLALMGA
jgi:hypothetical protein